MRASSLHLRTYAVRVTVTQRPHRPHSRFEVFDVTVLGASAVDAELVACQMAASVIPDSWLVTASEVQLP